MNNKEQQPPKHFKCIIDNEHGFEFSLNNKSFRNLISKENFIKLNIEDKQQFYLTYKIYLPNKIKYSKHYILQLKKEGKYFAKTNSLNPELYNEIIEYYLYNKDANWENGYEIEQIRIKLNNSLNEKHRSKIIESEYNKYFKKLHKNKISYWYFLDDNTLKELGYNNFIDYIKDEINERTDIIDEFITEFFPNFCGFDIFLNWNEIEIIRGILDFLKEYKENNPLMKRTSTNNDSTICNNKIEEKYYSTIFLGKNEENVFFELLDKLNAITIDKKPNGRKFQPICDAIFNSYSENKEKIFKYNIDIIDYIKYLKSAFFIEIKSNKLSSGVKHFEKTNQIFSECLKKLKEKK